MKWSCILGQVRGSTKLHSDQVSCRLIQLYRIKVCVIGRLFFKRDVWPPSVVKFDPAVDDTFGWEAVLQSVQEGSLLLEGSQTIRRRRL